MEEQKRDGDVPMHQAKVGAVHILIQHPDLLTLYTLNPGP